MIKFKYNTEKELLTMAWMKLLERRDDYPLRHDYEDMDLLQKKIDELEEYLNIDNHEIELDEENEK